MTDQFKKGDRVSWNTPQGETTGTVVDKITGERRVRGGQQKGTRVKGSADNPRYLVESETSGKQGRPSRRSLKKRS